MVSITILPLSSIASSRELAANHRLAINLPKASTNPNHPTAEWTLAESRVDRADARALVGGGDRSTRLPSDLAAQRRSTQPLVRLIRFDSIRFDSIRFDSIRFDSID